MAVGIENILNTQSDAHMRLRIAHIIMQRLDKINVNRENAECIRILLNIVEKYSSELSDTDRALIVEKRSQIERILS